jgi:uncharacterized membrane protein YoaK (UPF0700 family)
MHTVAAPETLYASYRHINSKTEGKIVLTVLLILAIIALICTIAAIVNRAPLYVAVLLLVLMELLRALPLGR